MVPYLLYSSAAHKPVYNCLTLVAKGSGLPELHGNIFGRAVLGKPPPSEHCTESRLKHKCKCEKVLLVWSLSQRDILQVSCTSIDLRKCFQEM